MDSRGRAGARVVAKVAGLTNLKRYSPPHLLPWTSRAVESSCTSGRSMYRLTSSANFSCIRTEQPTASVCKRVQIEMMQGSHHFIGYLLDSTVPTLVKRLLSFRTKSAIYICLMVAMIRWCWRQWPSMTFLQDTDAAPRLPVS
ncbi:MAG: hypothetical protein CM1200mP29_11550 [Verrucomicrobiota bacterium]|nr:MAG: hypothetical protein CM1200mP29_11550 [Verrucomicrobiota bacterium]